MTTGRWNQIVPWLRQIEELLARVTFRLLASMLKDQ
jgi:hypothetical protein